MPVWGGFDMRVGIQLPLRENIYDRVAWAAGLGFHSGQLCAWNIELYTEEIAEKLQKACDKMPY